MKWKGSGRKKSYPTLTYCSSMTGGEIYKWSQIRQLPPAWCEEEGNKVTYTSQVFTEICIKYTITLIFMCLRAQSTILLCFVHIFTCHCHQLHGHEYYRPRYHFSFQTSSNNCPVSASSVCVTPLNCKQSSSAVLLLVSRDMVRQPGRSWWKPLTETGFTAKNSWTPGCGKTKPKMVRPRKLDF